MSAKIQSSKKAAVATPANTNSSAAVRIGIRRSTAAVNRNARPEFTVGNTKPPHAPFPRKPVDMARKVTMGVSEGKRQVADRHITDQSTTEHPHPLKGKSEVTPERRSVSSINTASIKNIALPNEAVSRVDRPQKRCVSVDPTVKTCPLQGGLPPTTKTRESVRINTVARRQDEMKSIIRYADPRASATVSPFTATSTSPAPFATKLASRRSGLRRQSSVGNILKGDHSKEPMSMRRSFVAVRPPPIEVGTPNTRVIVHPVVHIAPQHQTPAQAEPPYGHRKLSLNRYHRKKSLEATKAHLRRKVALKTAFAYDSGTGEQTKHLVYANATAAASCRRVASPVCNKRHYGQAHTDIFGF